MRVSEIQRFAYTFNEAAKILGLHHRTLRLFAKRGELETVRFGSAIRIPCDSLERFVEERRSGQTVRSDGE